MKIEDRLSEYLINGGLFNPEMMEHDKVRDLLIDCRNSISTLTIERDKARESKRPFSDKLADEVIERQVKRIKELEVKLATYQSIVCQAE